MPSLLRVWNHGKSPDAVDVFADMFRLQTCFVNRPGVRCNRGLRDMIESFDQGYFDQGNRGITDTETSERRFRERAPIVRCYRLTRKVVRNNYVNLRMKMVGLCEQSARNLLTLSK